jgi:hypothetical protein
MNKECSLTGDTRISGALQAAMLVTPKLSTRDLHYVLGKQGIPQTADYKT